MSIRRDPGVESRSTAMVVQTGEMAAKVRPSVLPSVHHDERRARHPDLVLIYPSPCRRMSTIKIHGAVSYAIVHLPRPNPRRVFLLLSSSCACLPACRPSISTHSLVFQRPKSLTVPSWATLLTSEGKVAVAILSVLGVVRVSCLFFLGRAKGGWKGKRWWVDLKSRRERG